MENAYTIYTYIADIIIKIRSSLSESEMCIDKLLYDFKSRPEHSRAYVNILWEESDNIAVPPGDMIYSPDPTIKIYRTEANEYYAELTYHTEANSTPFKSVLHVKDNWNDIKMIEHRTGPEWISMIGSVAGELIVRSAILFIGGLFIHCSCLEDNGRGLIFIGHSGSGKSTQLKLWMDEPGVIAINDDRIAVKMDHGYPVCHGIPWRGSMNISRNYKTPLKAIFLLEKSNTNSVEPVSMASAAPYIATCSFLPYWDKSLMTMAMKNLDDILKHVPAYRLCCRPEKTVIPLVRSVL